MSKRDKRESPSSMLLRNADDPEGLHSWVELDGWAIDGNVVVWQSREAALFRRVDCRTILLGPCKVQALCLWVQRPADVDAPLRDQQRSAGLIAPTRR